MSALTTVVAAVCTVGVSAGEPEVFSTAGYEADRAAAIEQERLHLVYATATWCPPCQRMKKTTWVDADVESWVEQHGIVTALDVDESPRVAADLGVSAMPTMILFEGGEELGRTVGYQSAVDLVSWMEAGRNGDLPEFEGAAGAGNGGGNDSAVDAEYDAARTMLATGKYEEATRAYIDLWETVLDRRPSYYGVRLSYMVGEMSELALAHEPAKEAFTEIRDREADVLRAGEGDWDTLADWVHLNQVLADYEATMAWVERISERPASRSTLDRFADEITEQASQIGRWDVIALAVPNPVSEAREQMQFIEMMQAWVDEDTLDDPTSLAWHFRPAIVGALHAGDDGSKEQELVEYLETACGQSDAWRVAFISIADECGKLRPEHKAWRPEHDLDRRYPTGVRGKPEF